MEVEVTIGDEDVIISSQTDKVRIYTGLPELDHVEVDQPGNSRLIFNCRELIDTMLRAGFPVLSTYETPPPRHEYILSAYTAVISEGIDAELDQLEEP